jgi:ribokinase
VAGAGKVVVVGSFNVDHVWRCAELPAPGATLAGEYLSGPGGKGFNQAVAAARAGAATSFVCALGDDAGGALARSLAAGDAIDLHAMSSDAPTGTAGIFVDAAGRNSIVIGAGANARLEPASVESRAPLFRDAAVVLAQLETPYDTVVAALRAGRACGATTLLNPAPAPALAAAARDALLGLADVLTPNETEFASLANASGAAIGAEAVAGMDDAALHALCRGLLPGGTVVVTLGAAGAFVSHRDDDHRGDTRNCYRLPAERVAAIDTTGAGDAFNGALAAAIAGSGAAFADMARFAGRYAALSTERHGAAASMPSREQVEARFTPD